MAKTTRSRFFNIFMTIILSVAVILVNMYLNPTALNIESFSFEQFTSILGKLFIVTLLVERTLEVFVNVWREPGVRLMKAQIAQLKGELSGMESAVAEKMTTSDNLSIHKEFNAQVQKPVVGDSMLEHRVSECKSAIEAKEYEYTQFKSTTQRNILWTGLIIGILISLGGFRIVSELVTMDVGLVSELQRQLFNFIDVALTGSLIAGGSESMHSLMRTFNKFMEATAVRAESNSAIIKQNPIVVQPPVNYPPAQYPPQNYPPL